MADGRSKAVPSLDQERARFAWEKMHDDEMAGDEAYKRVAKSAPAMLVGSGLMQLLSFLQAKGKQHEKLADHLREWLARGSWDSDSAKPGADRKYEKFMQHLYESDAAYYRRATEEALALLRWIRQFADATRRKGDRKGGAATA